MLSAKFATRLDEDLLSVNCSRVLHRASNLFQSSPMRTLDTDARVDVNSLISIVVALAGVDSDDRLVCSELAWPGRARAAMAGYCYAPRRATGVVKSAATAFSLSLIIPSVKP